MNWKEIQNPFLWLTISIILISMFRIHLANAPTCVYIVHVIVITSIIINVLFLNKENN
jgi:hypothetical protein